jgi:hypothetical protein
MVERSEEQPSPPGGENEGVDEDVRTQGGEGRRAEQASPPIGEDAEPGSTTTPPEEGDVGVPPDEEMNEES